jgi:hypothetical protein
VNQTVTGEEVLAGLELIKVKGYAGWRSLAENVRGTIVFCVMTLENNILVARSATN